MGASAQVIGAGAGKYVHLLALGVRYVISGEQTGGAFALVEHDLPPRKLGAPMRVHEREDEISHVTAGRLGAQIGDEVIEAGPGDTVVKPRGIPHAFWNAGDETLRFLELITPPAFAQYFADIAPRLEGGLRDEEAIGAVMARYGLSMDLDSIGPLIAAHGLDLPPS